MSSNKNTNFRKVVYYYLSDIIINNNKDAIKKKYRSLHIETIYLNDDLLEYRNNIIKKFKNVLSIIDELKYLPPTKIGRLYFQGGYLYHESKNRFNLIAPMISL
jgi:hypothetical protein